MDRVHQLFGIVLPAGIAICLGHAALGQQETLPDLFLRVGLTGRLGAFGEWEMLLDHGPAADTTQHMLGGGFSWLVNDRLQLTWRAAGGVTNRLPISSPTSAWRGDSDALPCPIGGKPTAYRIPASAQQSGYLASHTK